MNGALSRPWRSGQSGALSPEQIAFLQNATPEQLAYLESLSSQQCYPNYPACPPDNRLMAKNFRKRGCPPMNQYGMCPPNGGQYSPQWQGNPWCPGSEPCQDKFLSSPEIIVPAGGTAAFSVSTPEMFKGERLYVVSSLAQYFRINSLQIGSQLIIINPMYADVINEASNDVSIALQVMTPGVTANGTVTNLDTVNAHPFILTIIGKSLCY